MGDGGSNVNKVFFYQSKSLTRNLPHFLFEKVKMANLTLKVNQYILR